MGKKGKGRSLLPKKPPNPFLLFCAEERIKLDSDLTHKPANDVAKVLGSRWKNLAVDEKKRFEELSRSQKENYDAEL